MRAAHDDKKQDDVPAPTKGIRIATRCATIEQFVETYHQVCEDSAIFIPNTQRPIKTVMQFRFDLLDGNPALLGIGTVVEELTTKHNRFDHVGIVVELQRLSRPSEITFDQMLAVRARKKLAAPRPVYPRAMTVPIEVIRSDRMTAEHKPLRLPIPPPTAVPSPATPLSLPRTKSVIALPTPAKKRTHTVQIPTLTAPPQKQAVASPVTLQPPAVPTPCVPSSIDDGWDSEPEPAVPVAAVAAVPVAPVVAVAPVATTSIVEDSMDVDIDIDVVSAAQEVTVVLEHHASVGTPTVTAVDSVVACASEAGPFDTVTSVQQPNEILLALMRRSDGLASPAIIEVAPRAAFALSEPMQPIVEDRLPLAVVPSFPTDQTFAPPFPTIGAPFAPMPALAGVRAARRPWRWLAGAFAVLLCAIVATTVLVDGSAASVPPPTVAPAAPEPALESPAVATARDQAPTVVAAPKKPAIAPAAVAKSSPRVRPRSIERPSPRPQPATRPLLRRPAPKKCKQLRCL